VALLTQQRSQQPTDPMYLSTYVGCFVRLQFQIRQLDIKVLLKSLQCKQSPILLLWICIHSIDFSVSQPGLPDFPWNNIPKTGENIPNYHKLPIPNGRKIEQISIKYSNIVLTRPLKNLPKLGFLV
jgi:hypothetical protein